MAEQSTSDNASSSPKAGGTGGLNGQGKRPHSPDNQERAPRQSQPNRADELDGQGHVKIQPQVHVVRRACNECRQQKLRCDVVQDPFTSCSRCRRLELECKVESQFKRVGKRSKYAEMEDEIVELRRKLAISQAQSSPESHGHSSNHVSGIGLNNLSRYETTSQTEQFLGSHDAVTSLLNLRQGFNGSVAGTFLSNTNDVFSRQLENVRLSEDRVAHLFTLYFRMYHPFLPLLDPNEGPEYYFNLSPLLAWTIISIAARRFTHESSLLMSLSGPLTRLIWSTFAEVPHSYHMVKALCLFCTWPMPTSSILNDPTYMLCGLMMQVATQIGLHIPACAQDFTKFKVDLKDDDVRDRVKTWAVCNIVAQCVSTSFGQPPISFYNWTLEPLHSRTANHDLPESLRVRLRIEKFCYKVTKGLYSNDLDPVGLVNNEERTPIASLLAVDLQELEKECGPNMSPIEILHLRAAELHLRYFTFFDSGNTKHYNRNLTSLYFATVSFLQHALNLETSSGCLLSYATEYILQMFVSASFALLKLLNSFFAAHIDLEQGKFLFNWTVSALRKMSVSHNDRSARLADVIAQLWRAGGAGLKPPGRRSKGSENSLQLKVRCRMSMSHVFDAVWRWRENFEAKPRAQLEAASRNSTSTSHNQTTSALTNSSAENLDRMTMVPTATTITTPSSTFATTSVSVSAPPFDTSHDLGSSIDPGAGNTYGNNMYEGFDQLDGILDGFVDFPYDFSALQGMESNV